MRVHASRRSTRKRSTISGVKVVRSLRSAPAQNAEGAGLPAEPEPEVEEGRRGEEERRMRTRALGCCTGMVCRSMCSMSSSMRREMALRAAGRSSVSVRIPGAASCSVACGASALLPLLPPSAAAPAPGTSLPSAPTRRATALCCSQRREVDPGVCLAE